MLYFNFKQFKFKFIRVVRYLEKLHQTIEVDSNLIIFNT